MKNLLEKEHILYNAVANSPSDKDFFIEFHTYFLYVLNADDSLLINSIANKFSSRLKEEKSINAIETEIIKNAVKLLTELEDISKKLKLQNDSALQEEIQSTKSLLSGSTFLYDGEFLDSLYDNLYDILKRISDLGYLKEIESFVELSPTFTIKDIHVLKSRKEYLHKRGSFFTRDARTIEGALFRLFNIFKIITVLENTDFNSIHVDTQNVFRIYEARKMTTDFIKLMSGNIIESKHFRKEKYMSDVRRIHDFIIFNNLETEPEQKKETVGRIFYIEKDNIYHYKIGLLNYRKKGLKDPKYIKMFKNIINYVPAETVKIRVSEIQKNIPKKERVGVGYRNNIGENSTSFNNFLKKNGVYNTHPKHKTKIIEATDDYIIFNNSF